MRVLWTHNSDPARPNSLVYTNIAADGLRRRGVDLHLDYLGNLRSIRNVIQVRRRVRQAAAGFDLVHAQYGSACSLATVAVDGIPKVLSLRGNDWNVHSESLGFLYLHTRLARAMTLASLRRFDCVLPVSDRMAGEVRRRAPRSLVETLPSAIDLDRFVPRERAEARAQLGHPGNTDGWVLFAALKLDDPIKRYRLAQAAFDLARERRPELTLRVASDLPHEELPLFVAACDVILCTSESEGWPNSVKEALACNVPFVSTDVSDLAEIARRERSCRVCPPDARVLADNICDVLSLSGGHDLRRYVSHMGLDTSSDQLIDIYRRVLDRRKPGKN